MVTVAEPIDPMEEALGNAILGGTSMRMSRETEAQIWEAERRGAGPSSADLRPDTFDEDRDFDELASLPPCELCNTDYPRHTKGCPNGEDPNL